MWLNHTTVSSCSSSVARYAVSTILTTFCAIHASYALVQCAVNTQRVANLCSYTRHVVTHPAKLVAPAVGSTPRQYGGRGCRPHPLGGELPAAGVPGPDRQGGVRAESHPSRHR